MNIRRGAKISECGRYRYLLDRRWFDDGPLFTTSRIGHPIPLIFVMLNPSTADGLQDDRTIGRCISFAKREGYNWFEVLNLFAGRATKPADLFEMDDPEGPENRNYWQTAADWADYGSHIICGWGSNSNAKDQAAEFCSYMTSREVELHCLGTTKGGEPRHPLYLKGDAPLLPYTPTTKESQDG